MHVTQGYSSAARLKTGAAFETWWTELQEEVGKWLEAENTEVPDFEGTFAEYRIF